MPVPFQLPNPPPRFVGRAREIRWLRAAVARAPVTVIAGEGGLGKSALALFTLHARFPERVGGAIYLSLRDLDPLEPVALGLLRALVRAGGLRRFNWAELLAAPEALGAAAVELAEAERRWILLEDLHHGDPAQVDALLGHAARYARESRLLATTRHAPADDALLGQVLHLGAMSERDLTRLARALDPAANRAAIHGAVAQAAGSPWRLRRARPSAAPAPSLPRADAGSEILEVLRLLEISLPEAALARIVPVPPGDLDALERQGIIERRSEGVRLHETAEEALPALADEPRQRTLGARAAAVLAESSEGDAQIAALKLLLRAGAVDAAAAMLDASTPRLLEAGHAPALFRLLEGATEPRLLRTRLRCAVELGDVAALASVGAPADTDPEIRLLWARVLYAKGQMAETVRAADEVAAEAAAAGLSDVAFQAGLLAAQATANHAGVTAGLARFEALAPADPASIAQREAFRALALASLTRGDEALAAATLASRELSSIVWPVRGRVGATIARALWRVGRLREAVTILDAAMADGHDGSPRFDVGRGIRLSRAAMGLDTGELDRARAELDALEPYAGPSSLYYPYACQARISLAIEAGDLEGVDERAAAIAAGGPGSLQREAMYDGIRLAQLRRTRYVEPEGAPPVSMFGDAYRIHRVEHRLRFGEIGPEEALAELDAEAQHPELRMMRRRSRAVAKLVAGRTDEALAELDAALAMAREQGYRVQEAEAREVAGDVLLVRGEADRLAAITADLGALAAAMPSRRFACAARFFAAVASGPCDFAALEAIAGATLVAPYLALRARALLGASPPRDAVDALVLAAITRRPSFSAPETLGGAAVEPWQPGWGIDERASIVWLPDGSRVDFARQPVSWKILAALADGGGRATKEQLVAAVWSERDYHPLRHDNRLHVAVRALRARIEEDPARPSRVVTVDDGYAIGGVARRIRAHAQVT